MSHNESPVINAQTKQINGKAKALFPSQHPPQFRSTESETFKLDTMTGFRGNQLAMRGGDMSNQVTPIQDKNSILGTKPFLGINKKMFGKSPDNNNALNQTPLTYKSSNMSEMKL